VAEEILHATFLLSSAFHLDSIDEDRATRGQDTGLVRSWREPLDDTVGRGNWLHLGEVQAGRGQELVILGVGAFLAAAEDHMVM
jgi:hypothetical protein